MGKKKFVVDKDIEEDIIALHTEEIITVDVTINNINDQFFV